MTDETRKPEEQPSGSQQSSPQSNAQLANSPGVASSTVRIVQKAVSVLEEEIKIGIDATQRIEQKLVDVDKLRASQEIVQRFRRDAHDVVDILIDLVNVATNSLEQMTHRVIRVVEGDDLKRPFSRAVEPVMPTLTVATPIKPGDVANIPMTLENESGRPTDVINLFCTDLINSEGDRIEAERITFDPKKLVIEPHKEKNVTVQVQVPSGTPQGTYSGVLQASKLEQLRALLSVRVE